MDHHEVWALYKRAGEMLLRNAVKQSSETLTLKPEDVLGLVQFFRERMARLDCRVAWPFAELAGSHCPWESPCVRCSAERANEDA